MAHHGEADDYYNDRTAYQQYQPPSKPPPQQYDMPDYGANNEQMYSQAPPMYGATFVPPQNNKQDFQQTFKVAKPKWNDLWAGILVGASQCCSQQLMSDLDTADLRFPRFCRNFGTHSVSVL